jgi:hypothetical protein
MFEVSDETNETPNRGFEMTTKFVASVVFASLAILASAVGYMTVFCFSVAISG